jgi:hypothetical protein
MEIDNARTHATTLSTQQIIEIPLPEPVKQAKAIL